MSARRSLLLLRTSKHMTVSAFLMKPGPSGVQTHRRAQNMKILIVDDNGDNRRLLRYVVEKKGHEAIEAGDGLDGLRMAKIHAPDLIISDALMPVMDGFQFLRAIKEDERLTHIPFIFFSAIYKGNKDVDLAIALGAEAYIIKPKKLSDLWEEVEIILEEQKREKVITPELITDEEEYLKRYSQVVAAKLEEKVAELEREIAEHKKTEEELALLNEKLKEAAAELGQLFIGTITSLVSAMDAKSHWTKGHSERVTNYAVEIGREMGLKNDALERLRLSGLLHDIGKIGTYDVLLDKLENLTDEEIGMIKEHPRKGAEIIAPIKQLQDVIPGILHHHERFDGNGYPDGLRAENISLCARILCAADSFDSMTSDRPYRPSPGIEYAISEFKRYSGTQFDPDVAEAFLRVLSRQERVA